MRVVESVPILTVANRPAGQTWYQTPGLAAVTALGQPGKRLSFSEFVLGQRFGKSVISGLIS